MKLSLEELNAQIEVMGDKFVDGSLTSKNLEDHLDSVVENCFTEGLIYVSTVNISQKGVKQQACKTSRKSPDENQGLYFQKVQITNTEVFHLVSKFTLVGNKVESGTQYYYPPGELNYLIWLKIMNFIKETLK